MMVYAAAARADAQKPLNESAAMALLFATEAALRAADHAVQIHGGYGFTKEFPVERYYRDAKVCTIGPASSEELRAIVGRALLAEGI